MSSHKSGVLNSVAEQEGAATNQRSQSTLFLIMFFEKYLCFVYPASITIRDIVCVNGNLWYKSARDGKKPYMRRHNILTCFSTSQMEISSQRLSTAGHGYLSLLAIPSLMSVVGATTDRIRRIHLFITQSEADWIAEPMKQQYLLLTHLDLIAPPTYDPREVPYIFLGLSLGGSAPSLQHLCVDDFDYKGLPSLLLSAPNLISLQIKNIRPTCYVSPEDMVGALARLTKLRDLCIEFSTRIPIVQFRQVSESRRPHSPPLVRVILPALTKFQIGGNFNKYANDLMALVDAPRLKDLSVAYTGPDGWFDGEEGIDAGNLSHFISRTPTFKQFRRAELTLGCRGTYVKFDLPHGECQQACLTLTVLGNLAPYSDSAREMMHVLEQLTFLLSDVQHLSIKGTRSERQLKTDRLRNVDPLANWLSLLRSLSAVEVVCVVCTMEWYISRVLCDTPEDMAAATLPALQVLWLDVQAWMPQGKPIVSFERFLSLRGRSGRPVVIVNSRDRFVERLRPHQLELSESPLVAPVDAWF